MEIYNLTQKQMEKLVKESKNIIEDEKNKNMKEREKLDARDKFIEYAKAHFNPSKNITIIGTNTKLNPIYLKQFNDITLKEKNILKEFLNEGITNYFIISEKNKNVSLLNNVLEAAQINLLDHLKFFKNKDFYEFYGVETATNFSINENEINSNIEFKNNKVKLSKLLEDVVNKNIEDSFYVLDNKEIKNNLLLKYMNLNKEVFGIIFLDKYNQVIKHKNISEGTINYSFVYERELIKEALNTKNLKNIVIHHNHPSGSLNPSKQDIDLTRKLIKAFKMLDIGIVDHLIIGKHDILSLKNEMEVADFEEIKMSEKEKLFKEIEKELVIFPKSKINDSVENKLNLKNNEVKKEAKMEFKTFEEFKKDLEKEIINSLDNNEKLDIYNRYCENNLDYGSMIYENDKDYLQNMFEGDFNALAQAITGGKYNSNDDYVKLDSDGDLKSYSNLQLALKDNFIGNELIDFAMEHKDIHIDDLYDEYIHDTIESAQQTMSDEEYESALKEYTTDEMIEKYPEVNGIINRILDKEVSDEKDLKKSKDIND